MKKILLFTIIFLLSSSSFARHQAGIATAHPLATQAGEEILKVGGNAFDAAVAISAALAVVEPYSSGLGGGGFWLLHRAEDNSDIMIDGRETAPLTAHRDMYLDDKGEVIKGASIDGPLSAGIPGVPAALEHLAKHYGRLSLKQTLQPAIRLAQQGFAVEEHYRRMAGFRLEALRKSPAAAKVFLHNNDVPELNFIIKQPDLARTLEIIAAKGAAGFYQGKVAQQLVKGVSKNGGIWSLQDLNDYRIIERKPLIGEYRGMTLTSVAPPSSGGVAMIEILNQLANWKLENLSQSQRVHLIVETMRRTYRDRAEYLGDSDFVDVPVERLMNAHYAAGLAATIHPHKATPSELLPGVVSAPAAQDTTHFSVIDHQGNRVAATLSINYPFGSCFVAPGTGVLLNDEMDDFSSKPGVPNVYGLVGNEANAIEPGKRMLSSMSPTFLETEDRIAVIGTPGGSRIITMVLLGALEFFNGADAKTIVNLPRYHHQYLPDKIFYEADAFDAEMQDALKQKGHELQQGDRSWGNMHVVIQDKRSNRIDAASDKRGIGSSVIVD